MTEVTHVFCGFVPAISVRNFKVAKPALVDDSVVDFSFEDFRVECFVEIIF